MNLFHGYLVSLLFILDLFFFSYRITGQRNNLRDFGVSGNFWLVIFKISYLCFLCFMKPAQLLRAILPDVLIDNFDIVNFDKSADRFDIYLDEKKVFLK